MWIFHNAPDFISARSQSPRGMLHSADYSKNVNTIFLVLPFFFISFCHAFDKLNLVKTTEANLPCSSAENWQDNLHGILYRIQRCAYLTYCITYITVIQLFIIKCYLGWMMSLTYTVILVGNKLIDKLTTRIYRNT